MIITFTFCAVNSKLYLLSCDQIYAALFAIGDLSTEVIQDKQLTPTALQQHHLVLYLRECEKKNVSDVVANQGYDL